MSKRLKGKIFSVYLDEITKARLQALSEEISLSRSAVLRMLVGEKWKERHDQFLSAVKRFDDAKITMGSPDFTSYRSCRRRADV